MKKLIIILLTALSLLFPNNIKAENISVIDETGIFSDDDISVVEQYLKQVSDSRGLDVAVYITNIATDNVTLQGADHLDSLNFYNNGSILIINMANSEFDIVLMGECEVLAEYIYGGIQEVLPYLSDGDFVGACKKYANWIDESFYYYENPQADDDYNNEPIRQEMPIYTKLAISGCGAGIITLIVMLVLHKQLKTEGKAHNASSYIVPRSFNLTRSGDIFLYRNVIRHRRPKMDDNDRGGHHGGGSFVTGSSSSGHSYSGGGGSKF